MQNTKLARIYGRFSSIPQEKGDSKRRQVEGATTYAKTNNLTIQGVYFDDAVSGKAGANLEKEFGKLLREARPGEIVLVEQLDRIGRQNPFILGKLIFDLVQKGLTIIVWQDNKEISPDNIDTLATQFQVFTGAAVGHSENVRKIKRLRETMANALKQAEQGIQSGSLVKVLPQCFTWNADKGEIKLDEAKADVIRRVFSLFNEGKSRTAICKLFNEEHIPTLYVNQQVKVGNCKPWYESTIKHILQNESYAGILHVKGHTIKCIPYVVSRETYNKAQLLLTRYAGRKGKLTGRVNNLFHGLAVCKHCGGSVNVNVSPYKTSKGTTNIYAYRCKNARLHTCEHSTLLNAELVEVLFFMIFFMGQPEGVFNVDTAELKQRIEATEFRINKLTDAINNLYDMAEAGDTEAKDRIAKRKLEREEAEQEIKQLKGQAIEFANAPEVVTKIRDQLVTTGMIDNPEDELRAKLADNELRAKLRNSLPALFEKVIFDTTARTVEGVLKPGISTGTFLKDITKFSVPRLLHSKPRTRDLPKAAQRTC